MNRFDWRLMSRSIFVAIWLWANAEVVLVWMLPSEERTLCFSRLRTRLPCFQTASLIMTAWNCRNNTPSGRTRMNLIVLRTYHCDFRVCLYWNVILGNPPWQLLWANRKPKHFLHLGALVWISYHCAFRAYFRLLVYPVRKASIIMTNMEMLK